MSLSKPGQPSSCTRRRRVSLRPLGVAVVGAAVIGGGVAAASPASAAPSSSILSQIKACESGGSYTVVNPSSGASGAYQFLTSTWRGLPASAGYSTAASAPPSVQDRAARQLFAQAGTSPWTASSGCWSNGGPRAVAAPAASTRQSERLAGSTRVSVRRQQYTPRSGDRYPTRERPDSQSVQKSHVDEQQGEDS